MLRSGEVREQALAGIRAAYPALILLTVQCERVHRDLRTPEALLEALLEAARSVGERTFSHVVPEHLRQLGSGHERGMGVTLDLAQRNGSFGKPAVRVEHRVMRILPALLNQSVRRAALILDESVLVCIAVALQPLDCRHY